ncbi:Non-heme dioxygenase N-terminal domain-containing protein [Cynara cardunculus var. scolymus]|uniref:Non-heme dioxygenase N-terminal domain-containing protein n=1 Tax=Cynara cardunculus var. scolymus TaxID=59895 RepID=A0A118K721_CYNCS|nr:Non-heme dioxygenase N-terminal domain-containing protein [Cynara cardunculus var. scolymus]
MGDSNKVSNLNSIDLSSPDIPTSVSLLKQACMECGFFYVTNHGMSQEFMDQVFSESKKFFDLPLEQKLKLLRNEKNRGYTPVLDELLDPVNQLHGDHKEGFYIGIELPQDDPDAQRTFYGPNLWPPSVVRKIARLIALALDLDPDFFERPEMLGKPIAILRLLHYGGQVSDPAKGLFGAGAHSDYGLITLLATDGVPGLQGLRCKSWRYAGAMEQRYFQVDLASSVGQWSRAIFGTTFSRYYYIYSLDSNVPRTTSPLKLELIQAFCFLYVKIPYFVEPSHDCVVECLPTCQSKENPPKFPPVKCESYLLGRYRDTHADLNTYNKH